ncbi:DUF4262 domain-containing protein [Jiangella anatolica]|uniref:DUF4262 domain-containing protein n=1 Tax=Jiangella anatolica TaxID=2670374 RepID=A0A2W2CEC1_9ACTN|nr:DUF4262 domain-containing protein [Jiangella anatolica]PZF84006.1 DUF4262 domain-containing protein [Jiangella anatolica]
MMLDTCPAVEQQQWRDQEDAWLRDTVRRHGMAVQYAAGAPPFAYSVGLFGLGHPELLVYGLDLQSSAWVLNHLGERVRDGERFGPGRPLRLHGWSHRLQLFPFHDGEEPAVLGSAQRFYGRGPADPVPALQLIWDDADGRFPWDEGYELPAGLQPAPRPHSPE